MIHPIFVSKLNYGLELVADPFDPKNNVLKSLHKLNRQAMKAALNLPKRTDITDLELYSATKQCPVEALCKRKFALMSCKCLQENSHPLVSNHLEYHLHQRNTRQSTQRDYPTQKMNG